MDNSDLQSKLRAVLDAKTAARDQALASSRDAVRACGNAIRALHRYEIEPARGLIDQAHEHLATARDLLKDHPEVLYAGFVHDAEKEYAEALVTYGLVTNEGLPGFDDVGVPPQAFLKGMAEAIGELRRHILDQMRRGELKRCEELLASMDDIYYLLVSMDYPDGITFGLRRLTDVARSIIERTRGDFTVSTIQNALRDALEEHASVLEARES